MGIFSKFKTKNVSDGTDESLVPFITKFQKMIPEGFNQEINGKHCDTSNLRFVVDDLTRFASVGDDLQLLHFVARACVVSSEEFGTLEIEKIAKTLFDDFGVSGEIRRRYASNPAIVEGVTALGVASISILESNPKYPAVLEYLSANSEKLAAR